MNYIVSHFNFFSQWMLALTLTLILMKVKDPDNSSQTIYESWVGSSGSPLVSITANEVKLSECLYNLNIYMLKASSLPSKFGRLGGGSTDYAAFVQHVGIPAAEIFFGEGKYFFFFNHLIVNLTVNHSAIHTTIFISLLKQE